MSETVTTRIEVPAREGRAVRVPAGAAVRVTDVEGTQVADLFAFCAEDPVELLSAQHTRAALDRLFPRVGEAFATNRRRPILTVERDDSPGVHDMLIAACDPARYAGLGITDWHASCEENLQRAVAQFGIEQPAAPQSVNLFMNIPVGPGGELGWEPARSRAGDSITLRAEMDCIVAVSACPQDIIPINGGNPTAILLEVLAPAGS
jgi:uncharacterized protein YcgI (DUF1989 family)